MIKKIRIALVAVAMMAAGMFSMPAWSADVQVVWQEPAKYADINPGEEEKDKFEATLFVEFNKIFAGLAQNLPDGDHWEVTITDLDLAGEVRQPTQAGGRLIRSVKATDRPAITFTYKLTDAQGQLVKQDTVDLKDPAFMSRSPKLIGLRDKPFPYEEYMIKRWFEEQQNQKVLPPK